MKTNLLLGVVLASTSLVANAAPAKIDLHRVIEGALETIDTKQTQQQQLDINKVNQVITAAKNAVLPEFADFVSAADASIDPKTFNLDTLTLDLTSSVTIKKSAWAEAATTLNLDLGTTVVEKQDGQKLAANLEAGLKTQTLILAKYLANLGLAENPVDPENPDDAADAIARSFLTDVQNATSLDAIFARFLVLRDEVLASTAEELASAREFFTDVTIATSEGVLSIVVKPTDFYGVNFSASFTAGSDSLALKLGIVDVENALKEQIEEHKAEIVKALLEVQNATDQTKSEIEDGFRYLFGAAKELVGNEDDK